MAVAPIIDRVISYFNPRAGFERARFRALTGIVTSKRRYEGAGTGRRTSGWIAPNTGPNAEIMPALQRLRARSRDLVRNNPYASRAVQVIASNVVGAGIIPQQRNKVLDDLWKSWGDTTECDADGQNNFYGLQSIIMREIAEAGEVLVRRIFVGSSEKTKIPIKIQVIEADQIYDFQDSTLANGNVIKHGIEFDSNGKRLAYHLYSEHPGELNRVGVGYKPVRVPASEIAHIYRVDRAGQIRGVPWGSSILIKLKDFDEFDDAILMRQKIAACFAGYVIDKDGSVDGSSDTGLEHIEPGLIANLPPGKEIVFNTPPAVGVEYEPYAAVNLRSVATGFGVTYEALTQDYSKVNFSSGRMGWLEFQRNIDQWRYHMLIPGLCEKVWTWFAEAAELSGKANASRLKSISWTAPRREMINPVEEGEALKSMRRSGFISHAEVVRQLGYDPATVIDEIETENKTFDEKGLVLDIDPRRTSNAGLTQARPGGSLVPDAKDL